MGTHNTCLIMKTEEEIREQIKSLIEVVRDIDVRNTEINYMLDEMESKEDLLHTMGEIKTIQNQLLELFGNINALRWAIGEITDVKFAVETGTSLIEKSVGEWDENNL